MSFFKLLLAMLLLHSASAVDKPIWSSSYYAEGVISIPSAEVKEPFQVWYDSESNNSRIDYYNGSTKTYQLSQKGNFGSKLKIVPVTTETEQNTMKCFETNGTSSSRIFPQSCLPDFVYYNFVSKNSSENGKMVEEWMYILHDSKNETKVLLKSFLWFYREDDVIYPVKYEVKEGYNTEGVVSGLYDHIIVEYNNFKPVKPNSNIFNVTGFECESIPKPSIHHMYAFNPMTEFVNNYKEHVDSAFEEFIQQHHKNYTYGTAEHFKRKNIFRQNLRFIHSKNRANLGYSLAVNHLADYSNEELKVMRGFRNMNVGRYDDGKLFPFSQKDFKKLPSEFDWRINGAVTPVKDQVFCGSCWSFAATGAVEGAYFLKNHVLKNFSEQALVDCSWGFNNNGCDGGSFQGAFQWIKKHGLPTEKEYGPYIAEDDYCRMNNISDRNFPKTSYIHLIKQYDEEELKQALVEFGPIAVTINASPRSFTFYTGGIYKDETCTSTQVNHAVLLVGYGTLEEDPYWLLKNSWSTLWGIDGYMFIRRKNNICGVMNYPMFVRM